MSNTTRAWALDATNRGPSTRLWGRKAQPFTGQIWQDPNCGWGFWDDFTSIYATANRYTIVEADATASFGGLTTVVAGVARLAVTTTDNIEAYLGGGPDAGIVTMDDGGAKVWFECRVRTSSIADNAAGMFIGLAEEGWAAANALVDDTAATVTTKDHVGFHVLQADGDAVLGSHAQAAASTAAINPVHTMVADTWTKFGLYYDGTKCHWFVNGTPHATTVLATATNFPDGEELHVAAGVKMGSTTTINLDIDWWAVAMEAV